MHILLNNKLLTTTTDSIVYEERLLECVEEVSKGANLANTLNAPQQFKSP